MPWVRTSIPPSRATSIGSRRSIRSCARLVVTIGGGTYGEIERESTRGHRCPARGTLPDGLNRARFAIRLVHWRLPNRHLVAHDLPSLALPAMTESRVFSGLVGQTVVVVALLGGSSSPGRPWVASAISPFVQDSIRPKPPPVQKPTPAPKQPELRRRKPPPPPGRPRPDPARHICRPCIHAGAVSFARLIHHWRTT